MNILFLNSANAWGGNERWTQLACDVLSDKHNVHLAYRFDDVGKRIKVRKVKLPFYSEIDFYTIVQLIRYIQKFNIQVIIPTKRKDYFIAGILKRLTGVKNVIRLGIVRVISRNFINRRKYDLWNDGIIVNSIAVKTSLLQNLKIKPEKIHVVYNGLNLAEMDNLSSMSVEKSRFFPFQIVYVGEISRRKGILHLINAVSLICKDKKLKNSIGLLVIGAGRLIDQCKIEVRYMNMDDNIKFMNFQPNPFPYIVNSDIFVMPSETEGLSNALLEAMYMQLPVITTNGGGGVNEVFNISDVGFEFTYGDENQLSKKIVSFYENKSERKEKAKIAHDLIVHNFSLDKMYIQLEKVLSDTIASGK